MPPTARGSICQPAKVDGTMSSSLNGPRSWAMRRVGTIAWPAPAATAIRAAAMMARRVRTASGTLGPPDRPGREPAQAAVRGDDEHERRHEQHHAGALVLQEALAGLVAEVVG